MRISEHISYKEATRSNTALRLGIRNKPKDWQLENMTRIAIEVFEPVRWYFGVPIRINSFFRSVRLNKAIGGSSTSQHCKGQALDLDDTYGGLTNWQMFEYIKDNLSWDQMIIEYPSKGIMKWLHVSYVNEEQNRKQILVAKRKKGRTRYQVWNGKNHK